MYEKLKLFYKVVDVVNRPSRKICMTMLRHNVEKPDISYAQVQSLGKKKEDKKVQQIVCLIKKPDEVIYVLDVMNSVCDEFFY